MTSYNIYFLLFIAVLPLTLLPRKLQAAETSPLLLAGTGDGIGTCPTQASSEQVHRNISTTVRGFIKNFIRETYDVLYLSQECGSGEWHTVVDLDMTDPSQQCPSAWMEYNSGGVRACERIQNGVGGCDGTAFTTGHSYKKICGRATGYQVGGSSAFGFTTQPTIDLYYLYGLSITRGSPRKHIWTFATGLSEGDNSQASWHCPCTDPTNPDNEEIPSFVGDNYFCESGNPSNTWISNHLYSGDPLWDGEQCENEGVCCSNENSPPWFRVTLPSPTTDDIEARLCIPPFSSGEEVLLQKLEIYVQ